jgi:hypothetical protein
MLSAHTSKAFLLHQQQQQLPQQQQQVAANKLCAFFPLPFLSFLAHVCQRTKLLAYLCFNPISFVFSGSAVDLL